MANDYRNNDPEQLTTREIGDPQLGSRRSVYYALAAALVIAAVIGAFMFAPRSEQMARAPDRSHETTLPAPANPAKPSLATPGLPSAAPGASTSPMAPSPAPQQ
jgi:hypothetical protein